jgi:hypothetical protein
MKVFIASFGCADIIRKTLDLHDLHVDDVLTPGMYDDYKDGEDMGDKNRMIEDACAKHNLQHPLLVDDSPKNIHALPPNVLGYHVEGSRGLTVEDTTAILARLVTAGCDAVFVDADRTLFADHFTTFVTDPALVVLSEGGLPLLQILQHRLRPTAVAARLRRDAKAVETYKTSSMIPIETLPTLLDDQEAFFQRLPLSSHARDHAYGFNKEQMDLVEDTVAGRDTDHEILEQKHVAYAGGIDQYKRRLHKPVLSRRVYIPLSLQPVLHRRHAATPGVDFTVRYTEALRPYMEEVDTQIITVRRAEGAAVGTTYAGKLMPGSNDPTDIAGILYKWYPATEAGEADRIADAAKFCDAVEKDGIVCALIDARDYQHLVRAPR